MNYYNEYDAKAAAWLRELIKRGLIPPGDVDERSITDVKPNDLKGYTQVHFFAGIAGWSEAMRLAGWPADRPVWTGSCPCQSFSTAGQRKGTGDHRDLWPVFAALIRECKPPVVFGEQVEAAIGYGWFDRVRADLEAEGYAVGGHVLGAHSAGAPHIRQRLYWVADAGRNGMRRSTGRGETVSGRSCAEAPGSSDADRLGQSIEPGLEGHAGNERDWSEPGRERADKVGSTAEAGSDGWVEESAVVGCRALRAESAGQQRCAESDRASGFWDNSIWLPCRDGKARRVKPGLPLLASRLPTGMVPSSDCSIEEAQATSEARVMRLRGYGNAIVPQVAAEFIKAYMEL